MNDRIGEKYHIGDGAFSIQQMRRSGYNTMPRPHSHSFYELYYLLDGERVYFMNGKVYTAAKGDLVVVVPQDLHSTASSQIEEVERILVQFSSGFLPPGSPLLSLPPLMESALLRFPIHEQAELEHLLLQMISECKEKPPLYESYVSHLLQQLLIRIHRAGSTGTDGNEPIHPMHQKVSEIASYIHEHYQEPITLEQVSKQFYISPAYLSRVFLKLTGFHFSEYVRVVRVREAQKLLRTTREKIHTIAERVGFEHVSHFNKTFKKITGFSPMHYRKHIKAESV